MRGFFRQPLVRDQLLVAGVAALVFFLRLGAADLFDEDEAKNAVCGREMRARHDWIVPTFNGELRTDKPILLYWAMRVSYAAFGVDEFAARFASAVAACGTALAVYHLGRMLFDSRTGRLAALVQCTSLLVCVVSRQCTPDSLLIFCTTGALLAWVRGASLCGGASSDGSTLSNDFRLAAWQGLPPARWFQAAPAYALMGLGTLAKGPVAFVLPSAALGLFLLGRRSPEVSNGEIGDKTGLSRLGGLWKRLVATFAPRRVAHAALAMRLPLGLAIVALLALPWYAAVGWQTDGEWLEGFFGRHNVTRFLQPLENHRGPVFYYVPAVLIGFFPWSVFLPWALWSAATRLFRGEDRPAERLLLTWAAVWIAVFSLSQTKLPNYVAPAWPALSLLVASKLVAWKARGEAEECAIFRFRWGCAALAAAACGLLAATPFVVPRFLPGEIGLAIPAVALLIGAVAASLLAERDRRTEAIRSMVGASVASALLLVGFVVVRVSRHQEGPALARLIRNLPAGTVSPVATAEYFSPNLVYYSGHTISRPSSDRLREHFGLDPHALLVTPEERWEEVRAGLPRDVVILARHPRFLRQTSLVVAGRPFNVASQGDVTPK